MTDRNNLAGADRLLPPDEAARQLGVSPRTLLRYEAQGLISSRRTPGGHRRYRASDIDALADAPTAPAS